MCVCLAARFRRSVISQIIDKLTKAAIHLVEFFEVDVNPHLCAVGVGARTKTKVL